MLIPILLVQACYYYHQFQSREADELKTNLEVARAITKAFDEFIHHVIHQELAIGLHLTHDHSLSIEQMNEILRKNQADFPIPRNIAWITPQGRIVAASMAASIDRDVSNRPYFRDIVAGREWTVTDLIISTTTGEPIFAIARGIRDEEGNLLGIVCAFVLPDNLTGMLGIQRMDEGAITVVDKSARVVHRCPKVEWNWEKRSLPKDHPAIEVTLTGKEITGFLPGFIEGRRRMMAIAPVSSIGWVVVASRPVETVMGPIKSELFQQAGLYLVIIIAVFMVAFNISRSITMPIRELREHAIELGSGNSDRMVEVGGSAELQDLAYAFNTMVGEIRSREKALMESNEKFRLIFEHSPLGIYHFDQDGVITTCNDNLVEILGSSREKIIGFNLPTSMKDEQFKKAVSDCMSGKIGHFEGYYRSVTGKRAAPTRAILGPILSLTGTFLGGIGITEDISERMQAQEALRKSEEKYRELVENANSIILRLDGTGRITFFNEFAQKFFGYTEDEILGECALGTIVAETDSMGKNLGAMIQDVIQYSELYEYNENENIRRNGERVWVAWANKAIVDENGRVCEILSIGSDITARKRAEEALRLDEARFQVLYELSQMTEASPEEIQDFVLEQQMRITRSKIGAIVFLNEDETVGTTYAWSKQVMEQCSIESKPIRFPIDRAGLWAEAVRRREAVIVNDYENTPLPKKGFPQGHIPVRRFLTIPVFDEGRIAAVAIVGNKEEEYSASDVRQLTLLMDGMWKHIRKRKAQEALEESEKQLRLLSSRLLTAQEEERKRLAGELHDSIGASLGTVKFGLENTFYQMQDGTATPESVRLLIEVTQYAMEEARRIYMDLRPSMLDDLGIVATIGWFCRQFESIHPDLRIEKDVEIEEEGFPESLKIVVFRIIQEAFHNIAKYSRADLVNLSMTRNNGSIELAIEDNGLGFDPEAVRRRKDHKGGLGLTSMKERVELSGGSLAVESAAGEGATIRASWPASTLSKG